MARFYNLLLNRFLTLFSDSQTIAVAVFDHDKCMGSDCFQAKEEKKMVEVNDPCLRVLQPKENLSFWKNGHLLVEDDFTKYNLYACIQHSPYDKDEMKYLISNYGVMYSFKLDLKTKNTIRIKSLPKTLQYVRKHREMTNEKLTITCTTIPTAGHENTIVRTMTEKIQILESEIEMEKQHSANLERILLEEKIVVESSQTETEMAFHLQCRKCQTNQTIWNVSKQDSRMMSFLENLNGVTENGNVEETSVHVQAQSHEDQSHESKQTVNVEEKHCLRKKIKVSQKHNSFKCQHCLKLFKTKKSVKLHIKRLHPESLGLIM